VRLIDQLRHLIFRVFIAFFPRFAQVDDVYAATLLSAPEQALFMQMDVRDRLHGVMVAKALKARHPQVSQLLLRAALLHDIGKTARRYSALERIMVHLYVPKTMPLSPRLRGLAGAFQQRLHHAHYGAELIAAAGGHPRVAELVARHHEPNGDEEAQVLMMVEVLF
jgi:putative nucleotidyltransferase with HDIG domain